jgi:hypothetical protein
VAGARGALTSGCSWVVRLYQNAPGQPADPLGGARHAGTSTTRGRHTGARPWYRQPCSLH